LKCDGTRVQTRFRLSAKRTSSFKSAGASVQSTAGSRGVRISGSNAGYTKFRCSVKSTGYPLHSPVSPSLPLPCVTVCNHISTGLYNMSTIQRLLFDSPSQKQSNVFVSSWNMHTSVRYVMKLSVRQMAAQIMTHVSFLGLATIELAQPAARK